VKLGKVRSRIEGTSRRLVAISSQSRLLVGIPAFSHRISSAIHGCRRQGARREEQGVPMSEGHLLDKDGRPTTDPNALYCGGALLPFGGHKGSGLAIVADLLAARSPAPARPSGARPSW
jgi:hypothetical protein